MEQMRMNVNALFVLAAVVGAMSWASPVSAILVDINGTTVLSDDFEADAVGGNPIADVGSWAAASGGTGAVDVGDGVSPGAFEGTQYGRTVSGSGGGDWSRLKGAFTGTGLAGDALHLEMMLYVDDQVDMVLEKAGASAILLRVESTADVSFFNGAVWVDTGLDAVVDTWQKWEIDYVQGATTFTATIDGVAQAGIGVRTGFEGQMDKFGIWASDNASATVLIDAVPIPEPASLSLLAIGVAFMIKRRK